MKHMRRSVAYSRRGVSVSVGVSVSMDVDMDMCRRVS
jgi:hypothetical protein